MHREYGPYEIGNGEKLLGKKERGDKQQQRSRETSGPYSKLWQIRLHTKGGGLHSEGAELMVY